MLKTATTDQKRRIVLPGTKPVEVYAVRELAAGHMELSRMLTAPKKAAAAFGGGEDDECFCADPADELEHPAETEQGIVILIDTPQCLICLRLPWMWIVTKPISFGQPDLPVIIASNNAWSIAEVESAVATSACAMPISN
jgi:hypothetical protein